MLNIGNHRAEEVRTLVALLEQELGRKAVVRSAARPAADVVETYASVEAIGALTGFSPRDAAGRGDCPVCGLVPGFSRGVTRGLRGGAKKLLQPRLTGLADWPTSRPAATDKLTCIGPAVQLPSPVCAGLGATHRASRPVGP